MTEQQLDDLKQVKPGSEMFVQLATGISAKAEMKAKDELLVNVGSGVVVTKDIVETKNMVEENIVAIKKLQQELMHNLQEAGTRAVVLEEELQDLTK